MVKKKKRIAGGLPGHWAVWTCPAVELLDKVHNRQLPENVQDVLALANQITDSNAAFFDVANNFEGCTLGTSTKYWAGRGSLKASGL